MTINNDVVEAIGNTPLIKLKRASEQTGCTILGKAEFMNPGQSVKDRAGKWMILEAEKRGDLKPGGLVVESTAGNTGIGLAVVGSARGYRTLILIPETQSQEKKDMLRLCGADLRLVPALPYANPGNYVRYSEALAKEIASRGITVNALALGLIDTDMTTVLPEEYRKKMLDMVPLKRFGAVSDVTSVALFLLSDGAKYITGQVIQVDGGLAM